MRRGTRIPMLAAAVVAALAGWTAPAGADWERLPDLSSPIPALDDFSFATGPSGAAVVAWEEVRPPGARLATVVAALRDGPGPFAPPHAVPRAAGLGIPDLAVSRRGEAFAVWESFNSSFYGATRRPGGEFGPALPLRPPIALEALAGMAYDRAGTLYALYETVVRRRTRDAMLVRRQGSRFAARLLPRAPGRLVTAAFESRGGLTSLRLLSYRGRRYLGVQRRAPSGRGGPVQRLQRYACRTGEEGRLECTLDSSDVATAGGGAALAAWCVEQRRRVAVRVAQRRTATGRFGAPATLARARDACPLDVRMGERGDGVVAWSADDRVHVAVRSRDGRIGAPQTLGPTAWIDDPPALAVSASGGAVVAWEQPEGTLRASVRRPGGAFEPPRALATDLLGGPSVEAGIDAAGRALVVYLAQGAGLERSVRALAQR